MNTIADYVSQKEEIANLKAELRRIKKLYSNSKTELVRYKQEANITFQTARHNLTVSLILDRENNGLNLKEISQESKLSYQRVRFLASELKGIR